MESLEQINERFLKVAAEVNEYARFLEVHERCLRQSLKVVDSKALRASRDYITNHKNKIIEQEKWAREEWEHLCDARTFNYEELGQIIAMLLTRQEGVPYFSATRLVKHSFQVDEVNRPFYRVVSFVTSKPEDLRIMVMDKLTPTMMPYYLGMSPIMKPLPRELESLSEFEEMIRKELVARNSTNVYAITETDIPKGLAFSKPENHATFNAFPWEYLTTAIDACIRQKYDSKTLSKTEIETIIENFCTKQNTATSVAI